MPNKFLLAGAVSIIGTLSLSSAAFAGNCGSGFAGPGCNVGVNVVGGAAPIFDEMTIRNTPPGGHYRSISFKRAPNVSITRVHGMMPGAGLTDAPSAFTDGCHPQSTAYCRQDVGTPVDIEFNRPAPVVQAPAPVYVAPAPAPAPRVWTGGGYDASKFQSRQYGDDTFTPGTAYIPTSIVNRNPADADRMLNSGRAMPQPIANGGVAPRPHMVSRPAPVAMPTSVMAMNPHTGHTYGLPAPAAPRPSMVTGYGSYSPMPPPVLTGPAVSYGATPQTVLQQTPVPTRAQAPRQVNGNTYVSNIGADGTYWEKTSGMTRFGDTIATQVICKRKLPTQVVNPRVPVPYAVPTPVVCNTPAVHPGMPHNRPHQMPRNPGPWVY